MKWYFWVLIILAPILLVAAIVIGVVVLFAVNNSRNIIMSSDQLCRLPDDRLMIAIMDRIDKRFDRWNQSDYKNFSEVELAVYASANYNIEITNGGLCQYFVNSSRYTAPYLSDALKEIGALETEKDFTQFVLDNEIDLNDLSEFKINTDENFMQKHAMYPFEEFDNLYAENYTIENLDELIADYIREHITELE